MDDRTGTTASGRVRDPRRGPVGIARARPASGRETGSGRGTAAVTWPLFSGLGPLGALPTVPRLARTYTALVLGGWGLGGVVDDSQAVVSELAANAVHAATGEDGGPAYSGDGRLPVVWVRLMTDLALTGDRGLGHPALRCRRPGPAPRRPGRRVRPWPGDRRQPEH